MIVELADGPGESLKPLADIGRNVHRRIHQSVADVDLGGLAGDRPPAAPQVHRPLQLELAGVIDLGFPSSSYCRLADGTRRASR